VDSSEIPEGTEKKKMMRASEGQDVKKFGNRGGKRVRRYRWKQTAGKRKG
jgi:hypothetical protein